MAMHDFISEHEACSVTGMTPRTLQRFAEAGYLSVEIEHDGLRLFSKRQLASVFGGPVAQALGEDPHPLEPEAAPQVSAVEPALDAEIASIFTDEEPIPFRPAIDVVDSQPVVNLTEAATEKEQRSNGNAEVDRLKNVIALQEKILDLKDCEVGELRRERDWLRARIERLEEKSNRDQILLLSETQTIRRLIVMSESRKSTFRQMLEWCGLAKEDVTSNHDRVVDMVPANVGNEEKRTGNG